MRGGRLLIAAGTLLGALGTALVFIPIAASAASLPGTTSDETPCGSLFESYTYPQHPTHSSYAPWQVWDDFGPTAKTDPVWEASCMANFHVVQIVSVGAGGASFLALLGGLVIMERARARKPVGQRARI
jgi:hypothetical protein